MRVTTVDKHCKNRNILNIGLGTEMNVKDQFAVKREIPAEISGQVKDTSSTHQRHVKDMLMACEGHIKHTSLIFEKRRFEQWKFEHLIFWGRAVLQASIFHESLKLHRPV